MIFQGPQKLFLKTYFDGGQKWILQELTNKITEDCVPVLF